MNIQLIYIKRFRYYSVPFIVENDDFLSINSVIKIFTAIIVGSAIIRADSYFEAYANILDCHFRGVAFR